MRTKALAMVLLGAVLVLAYLSFRTVPSPVEAPTAQAPPTAPVPPPTAPPDPVAEFLAYLKTNPPTADLVRRIEELPSPGQPAMVDPLMKVIRNPKYDDDVRIAAIHSVGKQGVKSVAAILMAMADGKVWKEKPKLVAAAYEGAGDADADGQYKELMKAARRNLHRNGDLACAAFRAASRHVTRDSVDDFIKCLESADAALQQSAASKRPHHDACKPVLMECLKKMTGKNMNDPKVWGAWWKSARTGWIPPTPRREDGDLNASDTFTEDGYGFEIKKPNKAWQFRPGNGGAMVVRLEVLEEGSPAAWVEVIVQGTKNLRSQTPEAIAKEVRERLEPKFRTLKESEWDRKCEYGGLKGIEHVLDGRHKDLDAIHMHNVFLSRDGVMFYMSAVFKSGKKASLETDIDVILKSFRLTK